VRIFFFLLFLLALITTELSAFPQAQTPGPLAAPPAATAQQPASPPAAQNPPAMAQPAYTGPVIVIDPAHGGTDTGARGQNNIVEKDIVLQYARVARAELIRQGYKVVLTRDDDSNPSYDDRASVANGYREPIFVSLHISSTGASGTARAYFYQFWKPLPSVAPTPASSADGTSIPAFALTTAEMPQTSLVPWNEAQRNYADTSHRLADLLQAQLAPAFSGSPQASAGSEVRGLRSVTGAAVAIEISSVAVTDAKSLTVLAAPLAATMSKAIQAFRPLNGASSSGPLSGVSSSGPLTGAPTGTPTRPVPGAPNAPGAK
jgi:N-acetylmuramoyl-L-alanine amidase